MADHQAGGNVIGTSDMTSPTGNSSGRQEESLTVVILNRDGVRTGEEFATEDFVYIAKGVST